MNTYWPGLARARLTQWRLLNAMDEGGVRNNRTNAVAAFNKLGAAPHVGFTLAACCSMLVLETAGQNFWGHDPGGTAHPPDAGNVVVTEDAYLEYVRRVNEGFGWQGVGPCQLTWRSYQVEADRLGGCWKPYYNMLVGFQILRSDMLAGGSAFEGFWSWNGRTDAGRNYAENAVQIMDRFQSLFNAA